MSGPGRPRKPSHLRAVEGNRGKRPIPVEPATDAGTPEMPKNFTEAQREAWEEVVRRAPHGVVTQSEAHLLELTAVGIAKTREKDLGIYEAIAWHKRVLAYLGKLGMTQVDRAKLGTTPKKPEKASDLPAGLGHAQ